MTEQFMGGGDSGGGGGGGGGKAASSSASSTSGINFGGGLVTDNGGLTPLAGVIIGVFALMAFVGMIIAVARK